MAQLVSATLDAKTYAIWRTLDNKSEWLRRMLAYHGLENAVMVEHMGTPVASWGLFAGDARCNPYTNCPKCWAKSQVVWWSAQRDKSEALEELRRQRIRNEELGEEYVGDEHANNV